MTMQFTYATGAIEFFIIDRRAVNVDKFDCS